MSLLLVYLFFALGVSFLCSLLEAVLYSTPLSYITMKEGEGSRAASKFHAFKQDPSRAIAAILSLNTIANTVGAVGVGHQASIAFDSVPLGWISAGTTLLILIFSEIIPKTIGTTRYRALMPFAARMISALIFILFPVVVMVRALTRFFTPKNSEEDSAVSQEEVSAMANLAEEEGEIDESDNKIIQNIFKLDSLKAYDAMTPRVVAAIAPESMTVKEYYKDNQYLHHSRIPVYAESPEYITGYILRADALQLLADDKFDSRLGALKRDIIFFNEETSLGEIWDSLLGKNEQIAAIIDEYGCFQGILTLEDMIETILGLEIVDESDEVSDMQQYARERWDRRQKAKNAQAVPVKPESSRDGSKD